MTSYQAEICRAALRWGLTYIPDYGWVPRNPDWTPAGPSWRDFDVERLCHKFKFLQWYRPHEDKTIFRCHITKIGKRALKAHEDRTAFAERDQAWRACKQAAE